MKKFNGWLDPAQLPTGEGSGFNPVEFGLNIGTLTKFQYSNKLGSNKDGNGLNIEWEVNGNTYFNDSWEPDPSSEYYDKNHERMISTLTHYANVIAGTEKTKTALNKEFKSYEEYMKKIASLCKSGISKTFDIFLEWEYKIRTGKKNTYLHVPKNNGQGNIIQKHYPDIEWEKIITKSGSLNYRMVKDGNPVLNNEGKERLHTFKRSPWYMTQNSANQIKLDGDYSETSEDDSSSQLDEEVDDFFKDENSDNSKEEPKEVIDDDLPF